MNCYYLVGLEQVVAEDLSHAIRLHDPTCTVEVFLEPDRARLSLGALRPRAVILGRDPRGFPNSPLGQALVQAGIPYAFLTAIAEGWAPGTLVLQSPFSDETVAAFLQSLRV